MRKQSVRFANERGETLQGDLYLPVHRPRAFVLFAHCFTCAANWKAPVRIARALCNDGFAVLAFDFTGLGRSEGEFAETNLTTNVADLLAAARYIESAHGDGPQLLVGHSLGGAAALAAADRIDGLKGVVTIGAPSEASHVTHLLGDAVEEIEAKGEALVNIGGRSFPITKQLIDDLEAHSVPRNLSALRRALLIMHSPVDDVVAVSNAEEIFREAPYPKSFVSLDGADHLLSGERDAQHAAGVLAAWANRYVDDAATAAGAETADEAEHAVSAETGPDGFATGVDAAGHRLIVDEPAALGGSDLGPTPYELLAAALASCSSMTMQMYARRKGLALERASVRVRHSRVHAEDCETCETRDARIDRFDKEISLAGDLDEAARRRLLEIADRCPVHRTLKGEVLIETVSAD